MHPPVSPHSNMIPHHPLDELDEVQRRWLRRPDPLGGLLTAGLYWANWTAMRSLFRLRVEGMEHLPQDGPMIITPNHSSSLDAPSLAAILPLSLLRKTYWIARKGAISGNPIQRAAARLAHAMPVDRDRSALTAAAAVLESGFHLVWYPEGTRSQTGDLQPFQPGIGILLKEFGTPVLPVRISGAHAALPPGQRWPRLGSTIRVCIGRPLRIGDIPVADSEDNDDVIDRIVRRVRQRVEELPSSVNDHGSRLAGD